MTIRALMAGTFIASIAIIFAPGVARAACDPPPPTAKPTKESYWALQRFGLDRLPSGIDGRGTVVAVLDSGVEADHPLLTGRVIDGADMLHSSATRGREDCVGHGTAVASLIAGKAVGDFRGIAPGTTILPVRVSERTRADDKRAETASPQKLADAIDLAINRHVDVINMSFAITADRAEQSEADAPEVRSAIARAVAADIVIVAAVGNDHPKNVSFPAGYDGVLGVGAITGDGTRQQASMIGSFVKVTAPGENIAVAWPHGTRNVQTGTSFAAPIVAGVAALLRQAHPDWTARQVVDQITATADPSLGGRGSTTHGAGVVNPVRALTETVAVGKPFAVPALAATAADPAAVAAAARATSRRHLALWLAAAGAALAALTLLAATIRARARPRAEEIARDRAVSRK
ncbi:type VII secretion-associated serine protease mycosin [Allocatelliglobosispora scoriae]|uniref:Type VII secretion-associated serine protease mycosin n=1 Tax=Allocatelliglobosispora scoriae TaxID=643052 RepID=A0A841BX44_9ACTN|nr:S8 family serine peptidase [Allocatelliglobosispora scoriae]MBB5871300.1 type VII secretion-associated serine protease mycosin [Allocatelliglobosispora scoriae]